MSLMPYILNELLNERPSSLYDQNFGLGFNPHPYEGGLLVAPLRAGYLRPWRHTHQDRSGISSLVSDKDGFKVSLDVQQFKPEELSVKVVDDYICIEGKHEERSDEHGFVSRQFTRRYKLPENVDIAALKSSLSSDGVLQLHAPRKAIEGNKERAIPIVQTNQPAVKAADQKAQDKKQSGTEDKMES
uniref:SHSP domain-containing protein n=1 Tax=Cuerna arida TaxID=1464854 RepID=A0A1B6FS92_9HEMI